MHTDKQSGRQQVGADLSIVLQDGVLNEVCKHLVPVLFEFLTPLFCTKKKDRAEAEARQTWPPFIPPFS